MTRTATAGVSRETALVCLILFIHLGAVGETKMPAGHSVGKVSTFGDLIVLELDEGVRGKENLFDLGGRTLRFTPDGSQFRVDSGSLKWDPDFGQEISNQEVSLHNFRLPFSQKNWTSLQVGRAGWISFGGSNANQGNKPYSGGSVSIGRFDPLTEAAGKLVNTVPAICVFFKTAHVRARVRKGTRRCPGYYLGSYRALRQHSGLYVVQDREPVSDSTPSGWHDRNGV